MPLVEDDIRRVRDAETGGNIVTRYTVLDGVNLGEITWGWKMDWHRMPESERDLLRDFDCMQVMIAQRHPCDFLRYEWLRMLHMAQLCEQYLTTSSTGIPEEQKMADEPIGRWVHDQRRNPFPFFVLTEDVMSFLRLRSSSATIAPGAVVDVPRVMPSVLSQYRAIRIELRQPRLLRPRGPDLSAKVDVPEEDRDKVCCVCLVNQPQTVFLPCGHHRTCFLCTRLLCYKAGDYAMPQEHANCPCCKRDIRSYVQVFK
jgi:hypothetical protein